MKPVYAYFLQRLNKFLGKVKLDGREAFVFIPNPGRMEELLIEGAEVVLIPKNSPNRKTRFDLVGVKHGSTWVSIDSRMPNRFFEDAVKHSILPDFKGVDVAKSEFKFASSRFDFLLEDPEHHYLVEVKSCTLVRDGVAMFPDAPTTRGVRHVRELIEVTKNHGTLKPNSTKRLLAAIVFVIQRDDAEYFMPNYEMHPEFGEVLKEAYHVGVKVVAYRTRFDPQSLRLIYLDQLPIKF